MTSVARRTNYWNNMPDTDYDLGYLATSSTPSPMASLLDSKPRGDFHFRFLALPFELRSKIIKYTISSTYSTHELKAWQKLQHTGYRTGWEIKPENFTISSTGLKCHSMTSFNFALVNKQLRHDALSIIFRNATVCIHVHIPRYGPFSTIPKDISKTYRAVREYSMLLELARDITLIVDPQPSQMPEVELDLVPALYVIFRESRTFWGLLLMLCIVLLMLCIVIPVAGIVRLAARISAIAPFQGKRRTDLQALVDLLVQVPGSGTHMKIIVYLEHLHLQDLAIVLGLLNLRRGPTTLEEVWTSWHCFKGEEYMKEIYEKYHRDLVISAAEQARCFEIFSIPLEFDVDETDEGDVRGNQHIGRSRRTRTENNNIEVVIE